LALEALDLRLPPSSLLGTLANDPPPPSPDTSIPVLSSTDEAGLIFLGGGYRSLDLAPRIVNFTAVEVVGGLWRFSGDVIDEVPAGLTITLGGEPVSLQDQTATTDANGHFEIAVLMNTDGSDYGLASAQTVDAAGQSSNVALYNVTHG
jgi:hypothetical protein